MLYWVVATLEPTKKDRDEKGSMEKVIMQPELVVAKDEQAAVVKALTSHPELKDYDLDAVKIGVRPF